MQNKNSDFLQLQAEKAAWIKKRNELFAKGQILQNEFLRADLVATIACTYVLEREAQSLRDSLNIPQQGNIKQCKAKILNFLDYKGGKRGPD